jgi:hypothetical protein
MAIKANGSILSNPAAKNAFVEVANPNMPIWRCLYIFDPVPEIDRAKKAAGLIVDSSPPFPAFS